ncbi:cytochrome P450 [Polaromonas sp.]|uniref:cytochrome P450 n=1 Tax=Polaromonas sp. TaxID=1869339 RepID=UPI003753DF0D
MFDAAIQPPGDPIAAVTHPDPWPYYRQLRESRPSYFDAGLQLWVASSQSVIVEALHHPALTVRPPGEPVPAALQGTAAGEVFALLVRMTDGAFHAAHKPAVKQKVRRWSLAELAAASTAATADLWPRLGANNFLSRLPGQTMARLLSVPDLELDATCSQVQTFVQGIAAGASGTAVALASDAAEALMNQGKAEGLDAVQAANRIALMQQALDATAGLLGHSVLMLARYPELAEAAGDAPQAMREFVAEVERHQAPIQNTRRYAAQSLSLAGQPIEAGQGVLLVLASGNRDEALHAHPDHFDPQRSDGRSLGFGAGAHACPGAAIAIETVAACARWLGAGAQFGSYFGMQSGFRPLGNARIPVFEE